LFYFSPLALSGQGEEGPTRRKLLHNAALIPTPVHHPRHRRRRPDNPRRCRRRLARWVVAPWRRAALPAPARLAAPVQGTKEREL